MLRNTGSRSIQWLGIALYTLAAFLSLKIRIYARSFPLAFVFCYTEIFNVRGYFNNVFRVTV